MSGLQQHKFSILTVLEREQKSELCLMTLKSVPMRLHFFLEASANPFPWLSNVRRQPAFPGFRPLPPSFRCFSTSDSEEPFSKLPKAMHLDTWRSDATASFPPNSVQFPHYCIIGSDLVPFLSFLIFILHVKVILIRLSPWSGSFSRSDDYIQMQSGVCCLSMCKMERQAKKGQDPD